MIKSSKIFKKQHLNLFYRDNYTYQVLNNRYNSQKTGHPHSYSHKYRPRIKIEIYEILYENRGLIFRYCCSAYKEFPCDTNLDRLGKSAQKEERAKIHTNYVAVFKGPFKKYVTCQKPD